MQERKAVICLISRTSKGLRFYPAFKLASSSITVSQILWKTQYSWIDLFQDSLFYSTEFSVSFPVPDCFSLYSFIICFFKDIEQGWPRPVLPLSLFMSIIILLLQFVFFLDILHTKFTNFFSGFLQYPCQYFYCNSHLILH